VTTQQRYRLQDRGLTKLWGAVSVPGSTACSQTAVDNPASWFGTAPNDYRYQQESPQLTYPVGETPMRQPRSAIVERIKVALHAQYDAILQEPLPERWVDLIHRLNERERRERQGRSPAEPIKGSRSN